MKRKKGRKKRGPYLAMTKGPGRREYGARFRWLLDFLNADIDAISVKKFLDVFHDYLDFLFGDFTWRGNKEAFLQTVCQDTEINRSQLKSTQNLLLDELKNLQFCAQKIQSFKGNIVAFSRNGFKFSYYMKQDGTVTLKPDVMVLRANHLDEDFAKQREQGIFITGIADAKYTGFSVVGTQNAIKFFLYSLFEKISVYSIAHCPTCHKYFKKTRKKTSPLCNPCHKKETTYRWRNENRDRYNDYQNALRTDEMEGYKATWGSKEQEGTVSDNETT